MAPPHDLDERCSKSPFPCGCDGWSGCCCALKDVNDWPVSLPGDEAHGEFSHVLADEDIEFLIE